MTHVASVLLDEHLRGPLWRAIQWHNSRGIYPLDVVRVGDSPDLALGTKDAVLLVWCEREDRILVTFDSDTMSSHLANHLSTGHRSPGIFMVRRGSTLQLTAFLVAAAYASESPEWQDRIQFIP